MSDAKTNLDLKLRTKKELISDLWNNIVQFCEKYETQLIQCEIDLEKAREMSLECLRFILDQGKKGVNIADIFAIKQNELNVIRTKYLQAQAFNKLLKAGLNNNEAEKIAKKFAKDCDEAFQQSDPKLMDRINNNLGSLC